MKVVDAFWEKRNLGIPVIEVSLDGREDVKEVDAVLTGITAPYSVVKIPAGNTELLFAVQKMGYHMIEMSIQLERTTKNVSLPAMYKRFEPFVSVRKADALMQAKVLEEIRSGSIFETDRISRDPEFSQQMAGLRYYNWTRDELEKGAEMAIGYYKDEPVAFGINGCVKDKLYDAFLGGVFSEASNKGIGFLSIYANLVSIQEQGGIKMVTKVSSNNAPILRLHMQYNYEIRDMNYILIKHQ